MQINQKELIKDLVFEIALPFLDVLKNNQEIKDKIKEDEIFFVKVIVKAILMISIKKESIEEAIEYFTNGFAKLCFRDMDMWREYIKILKHIIQLYKTKNGIEYLDKEEINDIIEKILDALEKNMQKYCDKNEEIELTSKTQEFFDEMEGDDFFDFDSEMKDKNIDHMHYQDNEKISAKEFLENSDIDSDLIDEIKLAIDDYDEYSFEELNEEYLDVVLFVLRKFYTSFSLNPDFKDLNISIEELIRLLIGIKDEDLPVQQQELVRMMIDAIISDLKKWYQVVFVEQTAEDIHYLDASLLANIAQLKMFLEDLHE